MKKSLWCEKCGVGPYGQDRVRMHLANNPGHDTWVVEPPNVEQEEHMGGKTFDDALRAAFQAGVRYAVEDTEHEGFSDTTVGAITTEGEFKNWRRRWGGLANSDDALADIEGVEDRVSSTDLESVEALCRCPQWSRPHLYSKNCQSKKITYTLGDPQPAFKEDRNGSE